MFVSQLLIIRLASFLQGTYSMSLDVYTLNIKDFNFFFIFKSNFKVRLFFGHVAAVISTIIYIKLYGYLQVSLQDMVQLISYWFN